MATPSSFLPVFMAARKLLGYKIKIRQTRISIALAIELKLEQTTELGTNLGKVHRFV